MKRLLLLIAVVGVGTFANAQTVYDSITGGSFFTSGSSPRTSFADDMKTGAASGLLDNMAFGMAFNANATFYTFRARIKIYDSWNGAATGTNSVVGNLMGGFTTDVNSGLGAGAWLISVGGLQSLNINLAANTTYSWSMEFFDVGTLNRVAGDRCTPLFNGNATIAVGSNPDINYVRDGAVALDGVYTGAELRTVGVPFTMAGTFNVVPEPCTMIAAGLGLVAVVRRRKRA